MSTTTSTRLGDDFLRIPKLEVTGTNWVIYKDRFIVLGTTLTANDLMLTGTDEYERRLLKKNGKKDNKDVAFYSNNDSSGGKGQSGGSNSKNAECFKCKKKGHYKADCWAEGGGKGKGKVKAAAAAAAAKAEEVATWMAHAEANVLDFVEQDLEELKYSAEDEYAEMPELQSVSDSDSEGESTDSDSDLDGDFTDNDSDSDESMPDLQHVSDSEDEDRDSPGPSNASDSSSEGRDGYSPACPRIPSLSACVSRAA
ncbi:hypothetical protein DFH09DRAFT_1097612 [Mycena vulgaris]|nr:hypothetical protein DFH09DRAFT_1097612 [Mycena vulgaris]